MPRSNNGMRCTKVGMLHAFLAMLCPFLAMLCPFLAMLCPFLGMLCPFLAMLHAFAATPCESEDAIHEELHGHHALHGVPDASRGRESEFVRSSSERERRRPAYVGMP
jgi:hypothetical protein